MMAGYRRRNLVALRGRFVLCVCLNLAPLRSSDLVIIDWAFLDSSVDAERWLGYCLNIL